MSTAYRSRISASTGHPRRGWRMALLALGLVGSGCASTSPAARSDAESAHTVERLRAENASQVRKMEELENQVFILTSELENRRGGTPAAVTPPPPVLPEVKLAPGEKVPPPEKGGGPISLVDEAEVEYAGAAAERGSGKRPVLKLWGPGGDDLGGSSLAESESSRGEGDGASDAGRATRERHRSALSRRPPHPSSDPKPVATMPAADEPAPARTLAMASAPAHGSRAGISKSSREPTSTSTSTSTSASTPAADNALYQSALGQLRAGHHEEAVAGLRAFVAAHPQHDLADNAQYWLGECFYDRKDFSTALREFRRVVEAFPTGNKVPDALLKLGLSYLAIGSARPGREALTDLVRRFPQHPTAALAEARLAELPKEVR